LRRRRTETSTVVGKNKIGSQHIRPKSVVGRKPRGRTKASPPTYSSNAEASKLEGGDKTSSCSWNVSFYKCMHEDHDDRGCGCSQENDRRTTIENKRLEEREGSTTHFEEENHTKSYSGVAYLTATKKD